MISDSNQELFNNKLFIEGELKYQHNRGSVRRTAEFAGKYPVNALNRIETEIIPQYEKRIMQQKEQISAYQSIKYSFPNKVKLEAAQSRLADIKARLNRQYGENQRKVQLSFEKQQYGMKM
jgi:hypothetical protein